MSDETVYQAIIDHQYEDYKSFFDHPWSGKLMRLTNDTALEIPVFELCVHWRTMANAHAMPWILVESLGGLWASAFSANEMLGFSKRLTVLMRDKILGAVDLNNMKRQQVTAVMNEVAERFSRAEESHLAPPFPHEQLWTELCGLSEFQFAIMGSQRCCFGSLYHSYENFIRQVLGVVSGDPDYKIKSFDRFEADVRRLLGDAVMDQCILDSRVAIARLIRNCLAHAGGKESPELKKTGHPFPVVEGIVQVMAVHTADLFRILRSRVDLVVAEALSRLAAQAGR